MIVTGLRFVLKNDKRILQCKGIEFLGHNQDGTIGLGRNYGWQDVALEEIIESERHIKLKAELDDIPNEGDGY